MILKNKQHTNINKYQSKNPLKRYFLKKYYNFLLSSVTPYNNSTILDVGAGEGFTLNFLSEHQIGKTLMGIDKSSESRRISKILFPKINIQEGDIYKLPFKNSSFDLVMCLEVLEHLENPSLALDELKRVSKKYLLLSVPHEPLFMLGNLACGKNIKSFGNTPEHINHWGVRGFKKFLGRNGLKIKSISTLFFWIMVLCEK